MFPASRTGTQYVRYIYARTTGVFDAELQYESAYTPGLITHPPFTPLTSIYVKCRLYWHTLAILVAKQRVSTSGRLLHTNYQTV